MFAMSVNWWPSSVNAVAPEMRVRCASLTILGMCVCTIMSNLALCWSAREMRASVAPSIPSACLGWKSFDLSRSFTLSVCSLVDVAARDSSKVFVIPM